MTDPSYVPEEPAPLPAQPPRQRAYAPRVINPFYITFSLLTWTRLTLVTRPSNNGSNGTTTLPLSIRTVSIWHPTNRLALHPAPSWRQMKYMLDNLRSITTMLGDQEVGMLHLGICEETFNRVRRGPRSCPEQTSATSSQK